MVPLTQGACVHRVAHCIAWLISQQGSSGGAALGDVWSLSRESPDLHDRALWVSESDRSAHEPGRSSGKRGIQGRLLSDFRKHR